MMPVSPKKSKKKPIKKLKHEEVAEKLEETIEDTPVPVDSQPIVASPDFIVSMAIKQAETMDKLVSVLNFGFGAVSQALGPEGSRAVVELQKLKQDYINLQQQYGTLLNNYNQLQQYLYSLQQGSQYNGAQQSIPNSPTR